VAQATLDRFIGRATQLYEQGPGGGNASARLGLYVRRWGQWARAGLSEVRLLWVWPLGPFHPRPGVWGLIAGGRCCTPDP